MNVWLKIIILIFIMMLAIAAIVLGVYNLMTRNTKEPAVQPTPTAETAVQPTPTAETLTSQKHTILSGELLSDSHVRHIIPNITKQKVLNIRVYTTPLQRPITYIFNQSTPNEFEIITSIIPHSIIDTNIFLKLQPSFYTRRHLSDVAMVNQNLVFMIEDGVSFTIDLYQHNTISLSLGDMMFRGPVLTQINTFTTPHISGVYFGGKITSTSNGIPIVGHGMVAGGGFGSPEIPARLRIHVGSSAGIMTSPVDLNISLEFAKTIFGEEYIMTFYPPLVLTTRWLRAGEEVLAIAYYNQGCHIMYTNSDFSNLTIVGGIQDSALKVSDINSQTLQFTTSPDRHTGIFAGVDNDGNILIYHVPKLDNLQGTPSAFQLTPGTQIASGITGLHILNQRLVLVVCNATATLPGVYAYISGDNDLDVTPPTSDWIKTTVVDGNFFSVATLIHNNQVWVCYRRSGVADETDLFLAVGTPVGNPMTSITWTNNVLHGQSIPTTLFNLGLSISVANASGIRFFMDEVGDDVILVCGVEDQEVKIIYLTEPLGIPDSIVQWN